MKNKVRLVQKLVDNVPGIIYQFQRSSDGIYSFPYAGEGFRSIFGVAPEAVQENSDVIFSKVHPDDLEALILSIEKSANDMVDWNHEFRACLVNGDMGWIHGYAHPESRSDGNVLWHGYLNEITERKKLEEELLKFNRLNLLMGKINTMIIHAVDLESLFEEACQIAVMYGNFKMAWIGLIDPHGSVIRKVKSFGDQEKYLDEITPISFINKPFGPTARSILEKKTIVNSSTKSNEQVALWRVEALKRGFNSSISLPLFVKDTVIGCLNIYSDKENFFNEPEVKLLEEISQNVSYAVDVLEKEKALIQSEYRFRTVFEDAPIGIAVTDTRSGKLIKSNSKYLEILELNQSDLHSRNWMNVTYPDDLEVELNQMKLLKEGKINSYKMVKRITKRNGNVGWIEISVVPLFTEGETIIQHLCMLEDISERVKYETDLKHAVKSRDEFFSIASHELKTPITSLKLQVQLLKRDLQKDLQVIGEGNYFSKHVKALDLASRQADRLTFLVDNLLDVTRIGAGHFKIKPLKCDLSYILHEILERFQSLISESQNKIQCDIEPEISGLWDQGRIEQVLVNLISNAIKYAPGGPIQIILKQENNKAILKVADFGPGLPPESLERIFNQFERIQSSIKNISGLGLGLYIAKKIIDAHNGEISVTSEVGKGATFTVKLPLK